MSYSGEWYTPPCRTGDAKLDFLGDVLTPAHLAYELTGGAAKVFDTEACRWLDFFVRHAGVGQARPSELLGQQQFDHLWGQLGWEKPPNGPPLAYLALRDLIAEVAGLCARPSELHFYKAHAVVDGQGYNGCTEALFVQTGHGLLFINNDKTSGRSSTDVVPLMPGRLFLTPPNKRWVLLALSDIAYARSWVCGASMLPVYTAVMWRQGIEQMVPRADHTGLPKEDLDTARLRVAWLALESAIQPWILECDSCERVLVVHFEGMLTVRNSCHI